MTESTTFPQAVPFKAETRQLLNILIHSLYTEREIFLRELISNASDALTRMNYEMLTNRDIQEPDAELAIWVTADPEHNTVSIRDSGIGMTAQEMAENLGTIAHSGARAFLQAASQSTPETRLSDMIGQFGVGFYSAFMVAESIEVTSLSYKQGAQAALWTSNGEETYSIQPAEQTHRGTVVTIHLNADNKEFAQEYRLKQIIEKHSDYIPFPIYLGAEAKQVNRQTALWRSAPRQVKQEEAFDFYKQFTLDPEEPYAYTQISTDAPIQAYGLLFLPSDPERSILSMRSKEGLKLYARKVLIQDYCLDLLPEYLAFVQGVVDSEDIPLNVSRESIQSTPSMNQLRKLITARALDMIKNLSVNQPEKYNAFWQKFSRAIKQGLTSDMENQETLTSLLRFHSVKSPDKWLSLQEYKAAMPVDQKKIYYILGENEAALLHSPHLEAPRSLGYDVLFLSDAIMDPFMLLRVSKFEDLDLANVTAETFELKKQEPESSIQPMSDESRQDLVQRFEKHLASKISGVQISNRLVESPARLVDAANAPNPELQRVYKLLQRDIEVPLKVLEINPNHTILASLAALPVDDPLAGLIMEQVYEDALLVEGLHPDPSGMVQRIQTLMEQLLKKD